LTTPEITLGLVLALAAFAFKHFIGAGLLWQDSSSIVIPAFWAACVFGGWYTVGAALNFRREDISNDKATFVL